MKPVVNRKARFHYTTLEELEAGVALEGREVKSIKSGRIDISSAYVSIGGDEAFLVNASVPRYEFSAPDEKYDPDRRRKLLLKKAEILSLKGKLTQKGLTLIVTKVYTKRGRIKVGVALARGKSQFDKRQTLKERAAKRKISAAFKQIVHY